MFISLVVNLDCLILSRSAFDNNTIKDGSCLTSSNLVANYCSNHLFKINFNKDSS